MGTTYRVTVGSLSKNESNALKKDIDSLLVNVNQSMSTYIPDSELSVLNKSGVGTFDLSPQLAQVISRSRTISEKTDGLYDVTVGPLVNIWGFGPEGRRDSPPSAASVAEAMSRVGYQKFSVKGQKITKTSDVYIDLSSIAKGYGVDAVADLLSKKGYQNYLVEIGGEIVSKGINPKGHTWRVGIVKPQLGQQQASRAIDVAGYGIATSGDYLNFFENKGHHYGHTIDPRTGQPVEKDSVSVTIIADNCETADAWATALNTMDSKKAIEVASKYNLAAYIIAHKDGQLVASYTKAFEPFLE